MTRIIGYSLLSIGLPVFIFFLKYKGTAIALKELWFVLSILIIITGAYFIAKYKFQKLQNQHNDVNGDRLAMVEQLKRTGDKVRLTLDNAEVKSRNYQKELVNDSLPSRMELMDGLYESNRNYRTEVVQYTYIVYCKKYDDKMCKFVSQPTKLNVDVLKRYLESEKGIDLYIDPQNPMNYFFDLPYV